MAIVEIPYPSSLPTGQSDYVEQNNLIEAGFAMVNKPKWKTSNNINQGNVFQVGGTVYHATGDTAITGTPSDYVKLTPGVGVLAPTYVANLTGVTWSKIYNGYYDVSGNLYIFDELVAIQDGEISTANTRLWKAINDLVTGNFIYSGNPIFSGNPNFTNNISIKGNTAFKGMLEIALTNYTTTGIPQIVADSNVEINGSYYTNTVVVSITGATVNDTWYDILLTPSGTTFTATYIARGTGVWSDSKHGLYSGNNRVVACVKRDSSSSVWINKNILVVNNRTIGVKIEIGDWDMDLLTSKTVAHETGDRTKIRSVDAFIRNDTSSRYATLAQFSNTTDPNLLAAGVSEVTNATMTLLRRTGGIFDNTSYDSTSYNRGWIYLIYEV